MGFFNVKKFFADNMGHGNGGPYFVGLLLNVENENTSIPYVTYDCDINYNKDLYLLDSKEQKLCYENYTKRIGVSIFTKSSVDGFVYDILTGKTFPLVKEKSKYYSGNKKGDVMTTFVAVKENFKYIESPGYSLFRYSDFEDIKKGYYKFDQYNSEEYDKEVRDKCTKLVNDYIDEYNSKNYQKISPNDISYLQKELYKNVEKTFVDLAIKNTTELNKKIAIDYIIDKDIKAMSKMKEYNHAHFNRIVELLKNFYEKKEYKDVFQYLENHNKFRQYVTTSNKELYLDIIKQAKMQKETVKKEAEPVKEKKVNNTVNEKPVKKENVNIEQKKVINISTTGKTIEQVANEMTLLSKMGNVVNAVYDDVEFSTEYLKNEMEIIEYFFVKRYNLEPTNENVKKYNLIKK